MRALARRSAIGAMFTALAVGTLTIPASAEQEAPVPLADAGALTTWYRDGGGGIGQGGAVPGNATVPAQLTGTAFSQVAVSDLVAGRTADGKLVTWGSSSSDANKIPADLAAASIKQLATTQSGGVAVRADGTLQAWPANTSALNLQVPAGLTGVSSVSLGDYHGLALKTDGSVAAWPASHPAADQGENIVPSSLALPGAARKVVAFGQQSYAITTDNRLVAWGADNFGSTTVPAALTQPGAVKDVAAADRFAVALLTDGTVTTWGNRTTAGGTPITANDTPASLTGKTVTAIAAGSNGQNAYNVLALTSTGDLVQWGYANTTNGQTMQPVPTSLSGKKITSIATSGLTAVAITSDLLSVTPTTVSGTPKVGQTLTGTPGTFSGGGELTHQWLADGTPIAGATGTTLSLTEAQLGKTIALRTTSTRGSASATSTSTATAAVQPDQVASRVSGTATAGRFGSTGSRITATVSPASATGQVAVYNGSTRVATATLSGGRATVSLSSTALRVGASTLSIRYAGDSRTLASSGSVQVKVARATASVTAKVATKKIKAKKTKAKLSVTVRAAGAAPTGTVSVFQGSKKIGSAAVRNGKATVTLAKFKKAGKASLSVRYSGNGSIDPASRTLKVTVKR